MIADLPLLLEPILKENSPETIAIGIALFVGFFLILIIGGKVSGTGSNETGKPEKPVKFRKSTFRKRGAAIGLTKTQISTLENFMQNYTVRNPYALLTNSPQLDLILKKALADIDSQVSSPEVKEAQRSTIYGIKQVVDRAKGGAGKITSSKQIGAGQNATIRPEGGGKFPSLVVSKLRDMLALQIPRSEGGAEIRWKRGTKVNVFFLKGNGQGYSFNTKVTGYNSVKGTPCVLLQHSNSVQQARQRRYRRKDLDRPAYFYPVRILTMGTGKNQTKKAFIESKNGALGTILDISAGGCAVKTSHPLGKGHLVKIEFETARSKKIAAFGKVLNFRRVPPVGGIMNIMFTRVSKKNLNTINAFIYDLEKQQ